MDDKTRKEIQDVINEYERGGKKVINVIADLKRILDPKPSFAKGEIGRYVGGGRDIHFQVESITATHIKTTDYCSYHIENCRKLKSLPIAMIPWDSEDMPEGLENNGLVLYMRHDDVYVTGMAGELIWKNITEYHPITFLGDE